MCKPSTSQYCLPPSFKDYEDAVRPHLTVRNDPTKTKKQKIDASEEIGTLAAIQYNADRHGVSFNQAKTDHVEFRGPHVPDLFVPAKNEVKEAKGGSSSYGDRKDHLHGGRSKQCSPEYTEVITDLMVNSNYNGRHPQVGCATHSTNPDGKCGDCKKMERKRRRQSGSDMYTAFSTDNLEKHAVRGNFDGDCIKAPEKIEAYKIVGGTKQVI